MKTRTLIVILALTVGLNILAHFVFFRLDLTEDKRYSLSTPTKQLVAGLDSTLEVRILLNGNMNASFLRLQNATKEMLDELSVYGSVQYSVSAPTEGEEGIVAQLKPTVIHERQQNGQTVQTQLYPYATLRYAGRETYIPLLQNNRSLSGEENINLSIEQLEFAIAEAISGLTRQEVERIAFIEGHGELGERNVYDLSLSLSRYFQIDRGSLTGNVNDLLPYKALIIAAPQSEFSEADKFQLDQYLMRGGRIMWVLDGIQLSDEVLATNGFTPVIAKDLRLQDMLFRYGVRISPTLLQDAQCLPIPVDVSTDPSTPNWQPMPWYYAPLLLTSQASPITRNLGQVSSIFCSGLELVGGEDGLQKEVLLATSSASRAIGVPAEVNLSLVETDPSMWVHQYIPVAASIEGRFSSLFSHRMMPDGVVCNEIKKESEETKQIVIASGSIIRNEWQQSGPLPLGFDRYTQMQFANKDFLVNCVLYLTEDVGLIGLRNKELALRLLNDKRSHEMRTRVQVETIAIPLTLLLLLGIGVYLVRKKKYA